MRELLSNNLLFVGQLYEDKSLALRARDLIFFTTDLQTVRIVVDLMKTAKENTHIMQIFGKIELLSVHAN